MSANFRIALHRNSENLHLKLMGDFDGDSACELLNMLRKNSNNFRRVFIHTSSLKRVHPFGRHIFVSNLNSMSKQFIEFAFLGDKARELVLGHSESNESNEASGKVGPFSCENGDRVIGIDA